MPLSVPPYGSKVKARVARPSGRKLSWELAKSTVWISGMAVIVLVLWSVVSAAYAATVCHARRGRSCYGPQQITVTSCGMQHVQAFDFYVTAHVWGLLPGLVAVTRRSALSCYLCISLCLKPSMKCCAIFAYPHADKEPTTGVPLHDAGTLRSRMSTKIKPCHRCQGFR